MKPLLPVMLSLFFFNPILYSQCPLPEAMSLQDGNNIEAMILNGGDLFWDGGNPYFRTPSNFSNPVSSIFTASLLIGGYDSSGALKLSKQIYGRSVGDFEYLPGPLNEVGKLEEPYCTNFNKIWKSEFIEIAIHKADFSDDGVVNVPIESIYKWPGKGNPFFEAYNGFELPDFNEGWAPFYDQNNDNIYNPEDGDYPHPPHTIPELIPASINWTVFNDHTSDDPAGTNSIHAEIHLTTWSFNCTEEGPLNNSIFTSYKIINKGSEVIDSFHVSLWTDFDLGCSADDFLGCDSIQNAFYVYNADNFDGINSPDDCINPAYGENPPTQSIQFLNQKLNYFTYSNIANSNPPAPPGTTDPITDSQFFNFMTGAWTDGTPISYGGDAYNPQSIFTNHVFTENPNDINGWSMYTEGLDGRDVRSFATHIADTLFPQDIFTIDLAYTFHQNPELNHIEIVDEMYTTIGEIQQLYNQQFNTSCGLMTDLEEVNNNNISIAPNPSNGVFYLKTDHTEIRSLEIYNISGQLVWRDAANFTYSKTLDLTFLKNGIYFLKVSSNNGHFSKKLIIQ